MCKFQNSSLAHDEQAVDEGVEFTYAELDEFVRLLIEGDSLDDGDIVGDARLSRKDASPVKVTAALCAVGNSMRLYDFRGLHPVGSLDRQTRVAENLFRSPPMSPGTLLVVQSQERLSRDEPAYFSLRPVATLPDE